MKRLFCVQDCAVLGDIVAAAPDDLDNALERYERQRKPDAHALGTMDHQVLENRPLPSLPIFSETVSNPNPNDNPGSGQHN